MKLFRPLWSNLKPLTEEKGVERIKHLPVLAKEITAMLEPRDGQYFIDMTFGGGGHTKHLLSTQKKMTIFALDRDPAAFQRAIVLAKDVAAKENGQKVIPLLGRFSELSTLMRNLKAPTHFLDGAIMDLGTSSFQFEEGLRGFSLRANGPLDMRMDADRFPNMPTAADVVNTLGAEDLAKIFKTYGEEKYAMKVAQAIIDSRFMMKSLRTTQELATLVGNILGGERHDSLGRSAHPATKVFQALRIFVNNEMNEINYGIDLVSRYLKRSEHCPETEDANELVTEERANGGLLAAISFHSLEDKIVKGKFVGQEPTKAERNTIAYELPELGLPASAQKKQQKTWKFYQKRISYPSENEINLNPRSRSAKLRFGLRMNA